MRPSDTGVPQAEPGAIQIVVNRPNVRGFLFVNVVENAFPPGPTVVVAPLLSANDGRPINVTVVIGGPIKVVKSEYGKAQQVGHTTVFYARTRYPETSLARLAQANTLTQFDIAAQKIRNVAFMAGHFGPGSSRIPASARNALVERNSWVNVTALTVTPVTPFDTVIPGLGRTYTPHLDVWEAVSSNPISGLQLVASQGGAPTVTSNQIYWHARNVGTLFSASATYVDLAKQDQAHSNEFTAGIFVRLSGAAFIAFLQELPRKGQRDT